MKNPKFIPPPFRIVIDTREKPEHRLPFAEGIETVVRKIYPGDYSAEGLEHLIAFEKKDIADLIGTLFGKDNHTDGSTTPRVVRFVEELTAMGGYRVRAVVVTGPRSDIERHHYCSSVPPLNVFRVIAGIEAHTGVPFQFYESPAEAAADVSMRLLEFWEVFYGISSIKYIAGKARPERLERDHRPMPKP